MEKFKQDELELLKDKMHVNFDGIIKRCFDELPLNQLLTKKDVCDELKIKLNYEISCYLGYQLSC